MKWIDISRPLVEELAVWPGDERVRRKWTARIGEGGVVNLGAMSLTLHAGTHADAPLHVDQEGSSIDRLDLEAFIGPAVVIEVDQDTITMAHVRDVDPAETPRILFKTRHSLMDHHQWTDDVVSVEPEMLDWLGCHGTRLVGTDAPSLDPVYSKTLAAHHHLFEHGMVNLENLYLRDVTPGVYELVALPLLIPGADAAPVRAALRPL